jgi:cell wall-associated NlpC family hydrolase
MLAGCSASSLVRETPTATRPLTEDSANQASSRLVSPPRVSSAAEALRAEIDGWMGTPYLWGGDDHNGIDCSAFVQNVFRDALDVALPRTTATQRNSGSAVDQGELTFADLVFFFTPIKTNHVGIYLGDGRFAHASSSRGVTVSNLAESYWRDAYTMARRPVTPAVFQPVVSPVSEPDAPAQTAARPIPRPKPSRRSGW